MAKGNMLLGTLRGSIGDVTFSRSNGVQVSKAKATSVKNPRTSKQTYQRMFFATVAKAQSALKAIIDHSFEQVQHGQKSLQYFSKKNIALARNNATFSTFLQDWVAPGWSFVTPKWTSFACNKYRISEGSLPDAMLDCAPFIINDWPQNAGEDIRISDDYSPRTSIPFFMNFSIAEWEDSQIVEDAMRMVNAKPGDFMTFCYVTAKEADINQGADYHYPCYFHFIRLMFVEVSYLSQGSETVTQYNLVPSNIDGVQYYWNARYDLTQTTNPDAVMDNLLNYRLDVNVVKSQDSSPVSIPYLDLANLFSHYVSENLPFVNPLAAGDVILAGTWIHSRQLSAEKILVSTQDLELVDPSGDVYDFNLSIQAAYDEWQNIVKEVGNDSYILEGGTK